MNNYFEGKIEYTYSSKDADSFTEIVFIKENKFRIESSIGQHDSILIGVKNNLFEIDQKKKRIVDCRNLFILDKNKYNTIVHKNKIKTVQGYSCFTIEIKNNSKDEYRKIDEKVFVNNLFKVHPDIQYESAFFISSFLPLKISYSVEIDEKEVPVICEVSNLDTSSLKDELFDIESFIGFEKLSFEENEIIEEAERKKRREEEEHKHAKWMKEWEDGKEERDKQSKIIGEKIILLFENELNHPLSPKEKENPNSFFAEYLKKLNPDNLAIITKKFLEM